MVRLIMQAFKQSLEKKNLRFGIEHEKMWILTSRFNLHAYAPYWVLVYFQFSIAFSKRKLLPSEKLMVKNLND
jgi:hypothetical protein